MELLKDVRQLSSIGYGFMASKAMFAALDLDLFTSLALHPMQLDDLALDKAVPASRLQTLMSALCALGLVGRDNDGAYRNSPAADAYLNSASPSYYGDYFRFQIDRQIYPHFGHLLPAMRGTPGPRFYELAVDPEETRRFSVAQHVGSLGPAHILTRRLGSVPWRNVLDVAGGTGAFSITLCRANSEMRATILDYPNVCDVASAYVEEAGLSDRVAMVPGDARATEWPAGQDAVIMSYLLSAVSRDDICDLLIRAFEALLPGGTLVLHDFMVNDDLDGPTSAALWLLFNVISDPDAPQLHPRLLSSAAIDAGFVDPQEFELLPGITRVVTARKPAK